MVARKDINGQPLVAQPRQCAQQPDMAPWYHAPILKPVLEQVANDVQGFRFRGHLFQPPHKLPFPRLGGQPRINAQVKIRSKKCLFQGQMFFRCKGTKNSAPNRTGLAIKIGKLYLCPVKNYIDQSLWLSALVLLLLLVLAWLPKDIQIGDLTLRPMDILSDLRPDKPADPETPPVDTIGQHLALVDTLPTIPDSLVQTPHPDSVNLPVIRPEADSIQFGVQIEDYTFDHRGLAPFFAAIDSIRTHRRTVRVAFYGDSFVEGDILLGDLRDTLQSLWGGEGVGFVPITSEVAQFKRTLKHQFKGWQSHSIVKRDGNELPYGLNGHVYIPSPDASVRYEGADYFQHTRRWGQVRLFYTAENTVPMLWEHEGQNTQEVQLPAETGRVKMWKYAPGNASIRAFSMRFPQSNGLLLYGASLENGPGIYWDNFSVRGNSGGPLQRIGTDWMRQFDRYQHYDLIVIQLGLNAVTNNLNNIKWYQAELDRMFKHLRACFPKQPILVISVADRGGKTGSELATMAGVPAIASMQRGLARKHGFLFYDLYRGMGGPGTMIRFAQHRPRWANLDYTHLTHEGGRVMGHQLARLFLEEHYNKW